MSAGPRHPCPRGGNFLVHERCGQRRGVMSGVGPGTWPRQQRHPEGHPHLPLPRSQVWSFIVNSTVGNFRDSFLFVPADYEGTGLPTSLALCVPGASWKRSVVTPVRLEWFLSSRCATFSSTHVCTYAHTRMYTHTCTPGPAFSLEHQHYQPSHHPGPERAKRDRENKCLLSHHGKAKPGGDAVQPRQASGDKHASV